MVDVEAALAGRAEQTVERLRKLLQFCEGLIEMSALADTDVDRVAADHQPGIADAGFPQHPPHIVAQGVELFLAHGIGVDREQKVRAALQIESQDDMALRPFGPAIYHFGRKEIRYGKQNDDEGRE